MTMHPAVRRKTFSGRRVKPELARLWTDHVVWTRQVIVSKLAGLPDLGVALARLIRNQGDIAAAVGVPALAPLLREHIGIAVRLVEAAKAGNAAEVATLRGLWVANADAIVRLLGRPDLRPMFLDHLRLTEQEATARIRGDWATDVATFDAVLTQALAMADAMQRS